MALDTLLQNIQGLKRVSGSSVKIDLATSGAMVTKIAALRVAHQYKPVLLAKTGSLDLKRVTSVTEGGSIAGDTLLSETKNQYILVSVHT